MVDFRSGFTKVCHMTPLICFKIQVARKLKRNKKWEKVGNVTSKGA